MDLPILGRFQLQLPLARGGSSIVWEARDIQTGAPVAVKVLREETARDDQHAHLLRQEVRAMASLDHPHIVRIHDQGVVDPPAARFERGLVAGSPWLAMELTRGGTLQERAPALGWMDARPVWVQILEALAHAHARGVFHRDIKPGNVLFVDRGDVTKVADFGLRVALDDEVESGGRGGTPAYMAPEQIDGSWRDHGPWTDLYALGCLVWRWAAGHTPFIGSRAEVAAGHLNREPPRLEPRVAVPDDLEGWLRRLLAKQPDDRYAFAAEAARDLMALGALPTTRAPPTAATPIALAPDRTHQQRRGPTARTPQRPPRSEPVTAPTLVRLRAVPLVGRTSERGRLLAALEQMELERRPRAVVLRGASGTGKSALARWLAEHAHESGRAETLLAHHDVGGANGGLRGLVHRHLRTRGLRGDELLRRLHGALGVEAVPAPAAVAAWLDPQPGGVSVAGPAIAEQLLRQWAHAVPLVVCVEDAQWGFDALELALRLLSQSEGPPVLLLITVRDDLLAERPDESTRLAELSAHPRCDTLPVPPLPPDHLRGLLGLLSPGEPALHRDIAQRAAGHPLFAVHLLEEALEHPDADLPETVEALWGRRLETLLDGRPDWRTPLELAAALGQRVVGSEWVGACAAADVSAPGELVDALLERRMATRRRSGSRTWAFVHGWLRDAVLRRATATGQRAALHRACASALAGHPDTDPGRVGRHLLRAGAPLEALEPLRAGAERHLQLGSHREAKRLVTEWRWAIAQAEVPPDDPRQAAVFRVAWRLAMAARDLTTARTLVEGTLASARAHGWWTAEVHALSARSQMQGLQGGTGIDDAEAAVARAREQGDPRLVAGARLQRAKSRAREQGQGAHDELRDVAELLESLGQHEGAADAWTSLATSLYNRQDLSATVEALTQAERVAATHALGPHARGVAHNLRGAVGTILGAPQDARRHYAAAARLLAGTAPHLADLATLNLALMAVEDEAFDEARARVSQVLGEGLAVRRGRHLVLLACDADRPDAEAWGVHIAALLAAAEAGRADPAGAAICERAARRSLAAGFPGRAREALTLAATQHRGMGDDQAAARLLAEASTIGIPAARPGPPTR